MKQRLTLILQFLRNPTNNSFENETTATKIKWLLSILLLNIPIMFVAGTLQSIPEWLGFIDTSQHRLIKYFEDDNLLYLILFIVLIGPFFEELLIRLPLRVKPNNFIPIIFLGILINGTYLAYQYGEGFSWLVAIPVLLTILSVFFIFNPVQFQKTAFFLNSKYIYYFYTMSALFAILHLMNYQFSWNIIIFAPILILPQFIGGLLMGFLRIKLGFSWGVFLHMLHNALFLLPFYFFMNNTNQKVVSNIKTDGYQFEIVEGKSEQKEKASLSEVTPNEIILYGTIDEVIAKLARKDIKEIRFKNSLLAKKKISLTFKNDSAYTSEKTDSASHYALQNLLKTYKLSITKGKRWNQSSTLSICDNNLFQSNLSPHNDKENHSGFRSFYGRNDTIKLNNVNSKHLCRFIEINYNLNVINEIDELKRFSINVPKTTPSKLNKYFKNNYGIELKQKRVKTEFMIIGKQ